MPDSRDELLRCLALLGYRQDVQEHGDCWWGPHGCREDTLAEVIEAERALYLKDVGAQGGMGVPARVGGDKAPTDRIDARDEALKALRDLLAEVDREEGDEQTGYPVHSHEVPGVWNETGEECRVCAAWERARAVATEGAAQGEDHA